MDEMDLMEYCNQLPKNHLIHQELKTIKETIGLLNSMIKCGESHSDFSNKRVFESIKILS